jgi:hypothetical protein
MQWWFFWAYRDVEWSYGKFMLALAPLGLVYVLTSLLIPAEIDRIESWKAHFYEVRFWVCGLALAVVLVMVLCTVVLLGHPVVHARRVVPASLAVLFAAGMASKTPKIHQAIIIEALGAE